MLLESDPRKCYCFLTKAKIKEMANDTSYFKFGGRLLRLSWGTKKALNSFGQNIWGSHWQAIFSQINCVFDTWVRICGSLPLKGHLSWPRIQPPLPWHFISARHNKKFIFFFYKIQTVPGWLCCTRIFFPPSLVKPLGKMDQKKMRENKFQHDRARGGAIRATTIRAVAPPFWIVGLWEKKDPAALEIFSHNIRVNYRRVTSQERAICALNYFDEGGIPPKTGLN